MEFDAIRAGGYRYDGVEYHGRPDAYAVVDVGPMKELHAAGLADRYATYMHNELVLLVAKGNPKHIVGIDDLGRADVRSSLPNPLREGIMTYYGKPVLEAHGLYAKLTGGTECAACQASPNAWFTEVHHRETPARIIAGTSDTGIVWKTEALAAIARGDAVEYVTLPSADSLRDKVSYYITPLAATPAHKRLAEAYASYVTSEPGDAVYAKFGFVPATAAERAFRPL
jgi:ABC-type molybdate transport system substrate-binding protein